MMDWICYCRTWELARNKAETLSLSGYEVEIRPCRSMDYKYSIYRGRKKGKLVGYVDNERDAKLAVASIRNKGNNAWYIKVDNKFQILKGI